MDHQPEPTKFMSRKSCLIISLGLNVLLAVMVAREWQLDSGPGIHPFVFWAITHRVTPLPPAAPSAAPQVVEVANRFNWQQVEADDYRVFINNLRAIGCPDLTIYDVVSAEVDELFNGKAKELVDSVTGDFWNLIISPEKMEKIVREKQKELDALRDQKNEMMKTLFDGINLVEKKSRTDSDAWQLADWKQKFDFLPEEKIAKVFEILDAFKKANAELLASGLKFKGESAEWNQQFTEIQARRDRNLQDLFTPEEFVEYRLRTNSLDGFRYQVAAFDGTDEEFRAIALAKMNSQGDDAIQQLLGPERFAAYQRAQNNDYLQTLRITDRFNLPQEAAVQVFQTQQAALTQAKNINIDSSRTDDERQASLQALRSEMESSVKNVLGPTAFAVYQENGGYWLERLATAAPSKTK
jgi:hypothetical protein